MANEITLLTQPGKINQMTTKNRIVMSSAITNMAATDGSVTDQLIAYYVERGRGGAAIVNTGYSFISQRGRAGKYQVSTADDHNIPSLRKLTDAFHFIAPNGKIGSQLCHAGRQTTSNTTGLQPEAPSALVGPLPTGYTKDIPEEMSIKRITDVVIEFAQAARRSKESGFDLVEIHAAHGYLLGQFLSPFSNQRRDQYGNSFDNRLRFVIEVLEAVRGIVGKDYPIGIRINGDDLMDGGYSLEDYRMVAKSIENCGFADYISVSAGLHSPEGVSAMVAPMAMPMGFLEHLGSGIRSAMKNIPIFIVGRIKDPLVAEGILQRGSADYCVMTRALMADPELPNKVLEDRLEDIRPCIACMQGCTDRTWSQLDLSCLVNPAAGRDLDWNRLKPAEIIKRVLVVGGGPAGMEISRVAALRGHQVTLWEQSNQLGGAALLAAKPPRRDEFGDLPRWLSNQIKKAGVKIELNHKADSASIKLFNPDILIAATGALPEIPRNIPGWDLPHVVDLYSVLSGNITTGDRILVLGYDTQSVECAEWLSEQGKKVFLISGHETPAWQDPWEDLANDKNSFTGRYVLMNLAKEKIEFLPFMMIKAIETGAVVISKTGEQNPCTTHVRIGEIEDFRLEIDNVVINLRLRPVRDWMNDLHNSIPKIYQIGDCLEPRKAIDAMVDAGRIGRII
jgi:2,4-dienoyl-CoA reductase-like NADH-dependent reductase (Old Yellow Enzyme family)/thioredoxin reductase